jgi:hypothetical protein
MQLLRQACNTNGSQYNSFGKHSTQTDLNPIRLAKRATQIDLNAICSIEASKAIGSTLRRSSPQSYGDALIENLQK